MDDNPPTQHRFLSGLTQRKIRSQERSANIVIKVLLIGIVFIALLGFFGYENSFATTLVSPACFAIVIGGLVGCVELLGRYRYAPLRAAFTVSGGAYIAINLMAAWAAFYMIDAFQVLQNTTVAKDLTHILLAGFGSLVFMRSSFFKVRVGDADIGIGPSVVLDTLLLVADRGVDRREAVERAQDIASLVAEVSDPKLVAKMLTKYCLALMQNVDDKTGSEMTEAIERIMGDIQIPDEIRLDIVALKLGNVVGPDVLEAAVEALGQRLRSTSIQKEQSDPGSSNPPNPDFKPVLKEEDPSPTKAELVAEIEKKIKK